MAGGKCQIPRSVDSNFAYYVSVFEKLGTAGLLGLPKTQTHIVTPAQDAPILQEVATCGPVAMPVVSIVKLTDWLSCLQIVDAEPMICARSHHLVALRADVDVQDWTIVLWSQFEVTGWTRVPDWV